MLTRRYCSGESRGCPPHTGQEHLGARIESTTAEHPNQRDGGNDEKGMRKNGKQHSNCGDKGAWSCEMKIHVTTNWPSVDYELASFSIDVFLQHTRPHFILFLLRVFVLHIPSEILS